MDISLNTDKSAKFSLAVNVNDERNNMLSWTQTWSGIDLAASSDLKCKIQKKDAEGKWVDAGCCCTKEQTKDDWM